MGIYVRNLTAEVTEADLKAVFSSHGEIIGIDISNGKGFAFIEFASRDMMLDVLGSKNPFTLHGNTLKVEERSSRAGSKTSGGSGTKKEEGSGGRRGDGRKGNGGGEMGQSKGSYGKKSDVNGEAKKRSTGSGSGAKKGHAK